MPGSTSAKSFGPVMVVNIPLVDRLIIGTWEGRDAEGRRYFEVRGRVERGEGDGGRNVSILRVTMMLMNRVKRHRTVAMVNF